ncbi:MAG: methionine--tRNA ligase [Promethearchaeota archaeon]
MAAAADGSVVATSAREKGEEKAFYITTAIAYLNGPPHIGHALEIIQADCVARFYRTAGRRVVFQTGSDEHGVKILQAARAAGVDVKELVDRNHAAFVDLYHRLHASYDRFVRTTSEVHQRGVQKFWKAMAAAGDLYKAQYRALYCVGCEEFKTATDLVDGKCPYHPNREVEEVEEENYFFRLTKYRDRLVQMLESGELKVVPPKYNPRLLSFLKQEDLRDVSFSRQKRKLPWGIPVPGDDEHVVYVWADALSNYVTNVGYASDPEEFASIWPADVHLIGKDILKFHAIYWPSMLISAGVPLPRQIFVHAFIKMEDQKIGKSVGNVIDPFVLTDKYGVPTFRFYLLKNISTHSDGVFREEDLVYTHNNVLADDLGNLVRRVLTFVENEFGGQVPEPGELADVDREFVGKFEFVDEVTAHFEAFALKKALDRVWELVKAANKYIDDTKPWTLDGASQGGRLATVVHVLVEALRVLTIYLHPFIPSVAEEIARRLGREEPPLLANARYDPSNRSTVTRGPVLFPKVKLDGTRGGPAATGAEMGRAGSPSSTSALAKLDLRVAKVVEAERLGSGDALKVVLDVGDRQLVVCANVGGSYAPGDLIGKKFVVLVNVKPREVAGVTSEAAFLGGTDPASGKVAIATAGGEPGERLSFEGVEPLAGAPPVTSKQVRKAKMVAGGGRVLARGKALNGARVDLPDDTRLG